MMLLATFKPVVALRGFPRQKKTSNAMTWSCEGALGSLTATNFSPQACEEEVAYIFVIS
jgi:hypothetical protein